MKDLVAWFGPVADFQVEGATVPGATEKFFACVGALAKPLCNDVAWGFQDADGRALPGMVKASGLSMEELGDVFLGAFSAGGKVVRKLLFDPRDRSRVRAVLLSDATYADWLSAADRVPFVQPQLVDYAAEIIAGSGQLIVATASPSPNFELPTGVEVLRRLRFEIEQRTGLKFERLTHFFGVEPPPEAAYQLGDVILAEYPMKPLGHKHTDIAPQVWQKVLWPGLSATPLPAPGPPPSPGPAEPGPEEPDRPVESLDVPVLAFAAGFAVAYVAMRALYRALEG